jgi:DNA-binding FrmR family transcriptional regulator
MATENMIKFYKGALANLPAAGTNGAIYITTDEGAIYLGTGVGMKRLGDFVQVDAVANLPASANTSALYYCVAENVLAKWNGTEWKQVNKQPTKDELKVMLGLDSEGDVTKAIAAAKKAGDDAQADVDTLTDYVGTFTHSTAKTVVEYINAKTDGIATSGNLEALAGRVTAVEGDVATIKSDYLKAEDKTELEGKITAAQNAADKAQGDVDTLAGTYATDKAALEGAIALKADASNVYTISDIDGKVDTINEAIDAKANAADVYTQGEIDEKVSALEEADEAISNLIGDVAEGKTVVEMIADAQDAASYDDEEVRGLIDTNAQAIEKEISDREGAVSGLKSELEGKIATKVEQDAYDTKVGALEDEDERLAGLIGDNADAIEGVSAKVDTLVGADTGKSVRYGWSASSACPGKYGRSSICRRPNW